MMAFWTVKPDLSEIRKRTLGYLNSEKRSTIQEAVSRAAGSSSQLSSIMLHIVFRPCKNTNVDHLIDYTIHCKIWFVSICVNITYNVIAPKFGDLWTTLICNNVFINCIQCWMRSQLIFEWKFVFRNLYTIGYSTSACQLPQYQCPGIHINAKERVAIEIDRTIKNLRCHIATSSKLRMRVTARHICRIENFETNFTKLRTLKQLILVKILKVKLSWRMVFTVKTSSQQSYSNKVSF